MFGLPVSRIQTNEASGLGSSIAAFVAKGVYKTYDEACEAMVHLRDTFTPDEKNHMLYEKLYTEVYSQLYSQLEPFYLKLKEIKKASR